MLPSISLDINASPTGVEGYHNSSSSLNNSSHNPIDASSAGPRSIDAEDVFDRWLGGIGTIDHDGWKNNNDEDNTGNRGGGYGVVNGELVLQMIVEMEQMIYRANVLSSTSSSASLSSSSFNNNNNNNMNSSSAVTLAASERTVSMSVDAAIAR